MVIVLLTAGLSGSAGLAVGLVVGVGLARRSASPVDATSVAMREAVGELDRRASETTNRAVQAAIAQVLEVNRAQMEQAASSHQADLAAQQQLGAQHIEFTARASKDELASAEQLIEQRLGQVQSELKSELTRVSDLLSSLQRASQDSFVRVSSQLEFHSATTRELAGSTQQLREALASTKARGQWGERMAEDVLHLAGFVEHINYEKQTALDDRRGIPDFTFLLPKGHKLFMDVKFPLSAYLRYLEAGSDTERAQARKQFLADVRLRVRELARREYSIDSSALTDVLLFIPNEAITGFIHEHDPSVFDEAMSQHIVFCSPLTLFAMLGVIRQAYDNFMVEQQATEILGLVSKFRVQWGKYGDQLDKLDRSFNTVHKAFLELNTTRRTQLERVVNQIDGVRQQRGVVAAGGELTAVEDSLLELDAG